MCLGVRISRSQYVPHASCQYTVCQVMSVEQCRVTRAGVGSFIFYHPHLCHLEYEDTVGALAHLETLGTG